jgi:cytochrome c oxidase subunit 4
MVDVHGNAEVQHESHGGVGKYLVVFLTLCLLTGASFFTYSDYWPYKATPAVGWAFMMAVSCTKAMLVVLFFMHLFWEANWKYVLTIPASFMSLFLLLMLIPDVGCRMHNGYAEYSEERLLHSAIPEETEGEGKGERTQDKAEQHE